MSNYDNGGCLHDLFTKQAAETPNKTAIVTADGKKVKITLKSSETITLLNYQ